MLSASNVFKFYLMAIIWLCLLHCSTCAFDCERCRCNSDYHRSRAANIRAICTGLFMTKIPQFRPDFAKRIYVLGLARNLINRITHEQLQSYTNLQLLDLRDQTSCVSYPSEFANKFTILAERCSSALEAVRPNLEKSKDSTQSPLLEGLKKHFIGFVPVDRVILNATNSNSTNITTVAPNRAVGISFDSANRITSILERLRLVLIEGGHTTLALILYAIISTITIISILTCVIRRCYKKRRANRLPVSANNFTLSPSVPHTDDDWPPPPPTPPPSSEEEEVVLAKSPAVLHAENVSSSEEELYCTMRPICSQNKSLKTHTA